MNLRFHLVVFFIITGFFVNAQKEAAIWYFGENAGLDFNTGAPVTLLDGALSTREGCATISDNNGSLLFYTDGITVWNRNHQAMPNGTGLLGDPSSTQSAIIVPHPGIPTQFYIFTADKIKEANGINYSVVDISLDGGLGDIIQKNIQLVTPAAEKLTAVKHANGTDIWVLTHDAFGDAYLAYRVTPTGVDTTPVISNVGINLTTYFFQSNIHAIGYLKASPDGKKVAAAHNGLNVDVMDFDSATGILTNAQTLLDFSEHYKLFYGVEFSPSSRFLYISSSLTTDLYQYDLEAADIRSSVVQLNTSSLIFGALQLGIDGKIYMADMERPTLSVIENPNEQGALSTLNYSAIDLGGRTIILGLPPFITSYFQVDIMVDGLCEGSPTTFESAISASPISMVWDFGDGTTSTLENPSHTYAVSGDYTVSVTVTTASETKTETKDITIYETPVAVPLADLEGCITQNSYNIDLPSFNPSVLGTQAPTIFTVDYFLSQADADANTNALEAVHPFPLGSTPVYVRVSNANNGQCYDTTQFNIIAREAPIVDTITDWTVCDDDTDGHYTFDLSLKNTEIFNGQDETTFEILYFASQADADAGANVLPVNYTNTLPTEEIFVRFQNSTHPTCFRTGSFMIEVSPGVTANTPSNLEICDDDNDGFTTFNLADTEPEIIGAQRASSLSISYHATMTDAEGNLNSLPISYTNSVSGNQTIYTRVENVSDTNCYATTSFELLVYNTPEQQTVTDWNVCDDDMDGFYEFNFTDKQAEILNGQDSAVFITSFYNNQTDADQGLNTIGPIYTNTTVSETIYYRIENSTYRECYRTGSFLIEVNAAVIANMPSNLENCDDDNDGFSTFSLADAEPEIIGAQSASALSVSYHTTLAEADTGLNPLPNSFTNTVASSQTIFVRVANVSDINCYATTSFKLLVYDIPQLQTVMDWNVCEDDMDGISSFDFIEKNIEILEGQNPTAFSVRYYETLADANLAQNEITGTYTNISNPQTIFYRIENSLHTACFVTDSFELEVFETPFAIAPTPIIGCDVNETGSQSIDLSQKNLEILGSQDPIEFTVAYYTSQSDAENSKNELSATAYVNSQAQETIYVRVERNTLESCYAMTSFEITVNPLPQPVLEERYVICPDSPALVIDGGDFETWSWQSSEGVELGTNRNFNVSVLGTYQLTVSQTTNGVRCENSRSFEVLSSGAPESMEVEVNGFSDQIDITVTAKGTGPFEYSVDGENYQASNEFVVFPGKHTVFVRDLLECRMLSEEIIAIGYQRFFTPNGDGKNEFWNIIGAELYPASRLFIYDRYGKFIVQVSPNSKGWDGSYNGNPLPASDYWFNYQYGTNQTMTGHFTLKR
ncbi:gliding motility-associated C-terminal domain-containing protein [Maribacter sedimenticola]|uniref:Gliding motility-associated C-terminal domain-containing protein n=1 Tax=Maribacter sedimenticola TaxID=228956 RepID=A0ABY1SM84_9FLAO|nr:T9SS type B sorting domain-containing protein [Maribacter sedimenticola]SNR80655.1 gliding motility-associated C-terminal domain-containing protein [Maribacter sedimenticola]